MRRRATVLIVLVCQAVSAGCRGSESRRTDRIRTPPPNLVLITIDTLRADRVGAYGSAAGATPALDALARGGAVFADATAHAPLTLPSHTSILTGRFPPAHGVHDNAGFVLADTVPTLATVLEHAGYQTGAVVASFVLRRSTGLGRGFDQYDDRFEGVGRSHITVTSLERRAPEVARAATRWLESARQPFFLWVHFYDPHAPYDPPASFRDRFPGRPYDGEVATADFGVSMIVNALAPEVRPRTVIVATGDHGESLGEHGEQEHGIFVYDATLRVPLIMKGPGVPATVVRQQARHVDIVPTVLELLGVATPAGLDGVSLVARLRGDTRTDPPLSYAESRFGELHFGWSPLRSVRDGTWKYIDAPSPELYHLPDDALERIDRHEARPETAAALALELRRRLASDGGQPSARPDASASEALRGLGYVSGSLDLGAKDTAPAHADPKTEIARYVAYVTAFNDALARLESGDVSGAEKRFRALATQFPRAFEPHQYLARALAARGARAEAEREYERALTLAPNQPDVHFEAARASADASRFDEAYARVAAGRRLDPAAFDGPLTEGLIAVAAGDTSRGEAALREALTMNPDLGLAHFELGRLAERRGDRGTALAEYRQAVESDPELADARRALERVSR